MLTRISFSFHVLSCAILTFFAVSLSSCTESTKGKSASVNKVAISNKGPGRPAEPEQDCSSGRLAIKCCSAGEYDNILFDSKAEPITFDNVKRLSAPSTITDT